jgi:hypothetical protein
MGSTLSKASRPTQGVKCFYSYKFYQIPSFGKNLVRLFLAL